MTSKSDIHRWQSRSISLIFTIMVLLTIATPVSAQDVNGKISIKPVGDDSGSFFTITAAPGETVELSVELANHGTAQIAATTFAADTFTMPNGGFGIQASDDEKAGTTLWISYPTDTLTLQPSEVVTRSFQLTVPIDTQPGDYLTSVVIQNTDVIKGTGAVSLDQIVRQAVAVSINVPGERVPAFNIGGVQHDVSAATSVVTFAVGNTGNQHLQPAGEFVLADADGTELYRQLVTMGRFYATTETTFAVATNQLLAPGDYLVSLVLTDPETGVTASMDRATMTVEEVDVPAVLNPDGSVNQPAQTNAPVAPAEGLSLTLVVTIALGSLALGVASAFGVIRVRSRRSSSIAR